MKTNKNIFYFDLENKKGRRIFLMDFTNIDFFSRTLYLFSLAYEEGFKAAEIKNGKNNKDCFKKALEFFEFKGYKITNIKPNF